MRCNRCGNNEAVFFYSTNINGEKSEGCLCADCARAEGLTDPGFGSFGDMLGGIFGDFFAPERSLLRSFGSFGAPVRGIMAPTAVMPAACAPCEEAESRIPADAGEDIRRRRELGALREQLSAAVRSEDYERAAELRDRLRAAESYFS